MTNTCFISGTSDKLMRISVDGKEYFVSEDIADSCTAKQLNEKIRTKLVETANKKVSILAQVDDMAKGMGVSKEELIKILGGVMPGSEPFKSTVEPEESTPAPSKMVAVKIEKKDQDEGFRSVEGGLVSPIRSRVNIEGEGISGTVPGYSVVKDGSNKAVVESDKKVKTIGNNTMIIKSNMGTTAIQVNSGDATKINKSISQTDAYGNLVRKSATGGHGSQGSECSLCRGTGFTTINQQTCPKCNGVGFIY